MTWLIYEEANLMMKKDEMLHDDVWSCYGAIEQLSSSCTYH